MQDRKEEFIRLYTTLRAAGLSHKEAYKKALNTSYSQPPKGG